MVDYGDSGAACKITDAITNVYIQCIDISMNGSMNTQIFHLAGRTSFSTRIGEQVQSVQIRGRLIYDDNVTPSLIKVALDAWMDSGITPISLYLTDDGSNEFYFRKYDETNVDHLEGYVKRYNIKWVKNRYDINITFEECWQ